MHSEKILVFDQDGTIYSSKSRLGTELSHRTRRWMCKELNMAETEFPAFKSRHPNFIDGLQANGLSLKDWHNLVLGPLSQEIDNFVEVDRLLLETFSSINKALYLVTFSSKKFTDALLNGLGCPHSFMQIFNLEHPDKETAYTQIISSSGISPEHIRVFGDNNQYDLCPASRLGMKTTLIDNGKTVVDYLK